MRRRLAFLAPLLLALALVPQLLGPAIAAWPLTPRTTYVSGTTPAIKAADLNAFQSAINGLYAGTGSVAGVFVDGIGGSVVTAPAGMVRVSGQVTGSTTPTATLGSGTLGRGSIPFCWARINFDSTFVIGANVTSVTSGAAGRSTITCNGAPPSSLSLGAIATSNTTTARLIAATATVVGSDAVVDVYAYSSPGVLATTSFTVLVFGE